MKENNLVYTYLIPVFLYVNMYNTFCNCSIQELINFVLFILKLLL